MESKLHILKNTIPLLQKSINNFSCVIEQPYWSGDENGGQPRFKNPHSGHFQLLMAVKVVSTLNAILCLLKEGYIQEVGALLRIIDECNAKICCIEEAHVKQELTDEQKKIVNEYFKYDIRSAEDVFNQKWWADMKKIIASQARFLSDGIPNKDVYNIQRNIQAIYDSYAGYIHAFYPHVMELYDYNDKSFKLNGLLNDSKYNAMMGAVSSGVLRSLNVFAQIALRFNLLQLRQELIKNRDMFIESEAYSERD